MSLLSGITSFITKEILGVEETKPQENSSASQSNDAIISGKEKVYEDVTKFGKTTPTKQQNNMVSQKAIEDTVSSIPSKNFNMRKLIKNGLIHKVLGISKEEFLSLKPQEQRVLIEAIKYSINKFENLVNSGQIDPNTNLDELIIYYAQTFREALASGEFETAKDFDDMSGNIVNDLGGNSFKQKTYSEQRKIYKARNAELRKCYLKEIESVKDLPEEQRVKAELKIKQKYNYIRRKQYMDIVSAYDTKTAMNGLTMLTPESMTDGFNIVVSTRTSKEEQTKAADYADFNFTQNLINDYKELGYKVDAQNVKNFTSAHMSYKSNEGVHKYQNDYMANRTKYEEVVQKQLNGEELSEEDKAILATMTPELYTAIAQGIGEGALNNVNMSIDEKAAFIDKWNEDAKSFKDYKTVVNEVNEKINNNEEYKNIKQKIEIIRAKRSAANADKKEQNTGNKSEKSSKYYTKPQIHTISPATAFTIKPTDTTDDSTVKNLTKATTNPINKGTTNTAEIIETIKTLNIDDAIKEFGIDAIQIILDTPSLKGKRSAIAVKIKSLDLNSLMQVSANCSDSAFIFICNNVDDSEKIKELKDFREKFKGLCFVARHQLEAMEKCYAA